MKTVFAFLFCFFVSGCSSLFFHPATGTYATPDTVGVSYESLGIPSAGASTLHAWLIKSETKKKGTVVFFHGNAENITTHSFGVIFLCAQGFDVLAVDYRGYGESAGEPSFDNMKQDIQASLDFALNTYEKPVFVLGQSLGASMTAVALADYPRQKELAGVVFDSGFAKMRRIAREKIAELWFLYPLQYPLSYLVSEKNPQKAVGNITIPKLFLASEKDIIVPFAHTQDLYDAAVSPKTLLITPAGGHILTMHTKDGRAAVLDFLEKNK